MQDKNTKATAGGAGRSGYFKDAIQLVASTLARSWPSKRPV